MTARLYSMWSEVVPAEPNCDREIEEEKLIIRITAEEEKKSEVQVPPSPLEASGTSSPTSQFAMTMATISTAVDDLGDHIDSHIPILSLAAQVLN